MEKTRTITIEVDEENEPITTLEEVLRQIKKGNTSGVYPSWDIVENN